MKAIFIVCFLFLTAECVQSLRLADRLMKEAGKILNDAKTDKTIRQCSCEEQHSCLVESRVQLSFCLDNCWDIVKEVTNNTEDLKKCFMHKIPMIEGFFDCLEVNLNSCSKSEKADNITYIDYKKVINNVESRINEQVMKLTKSLGNGVKKLVHTSLELGSCMKKCYMKENKNGFCFDRKGCQSKIEINNAIRGVKKCSGAIKWKEAAQESCECAVDAGVDSLKQYCNMFNSMQKKGGN